MASPIQRLQAAAERQVVLEDRMSASFARELAQVVKLLNAQVRRLVADLQAEKGRLVNTAANLGRAMRARQDLLGVIRKAGYRKLAEAATDAPLDALTAHILRTNAVAGAAAKLTPVDIGVVQALKSLNLASLLDIEASAVTTLWRTVLDGVLGARPVVDLVDDVSEVLDVSARKARVEYDTAVSTFGRKVDQLQATGAADEPFVYMGPLDELTRPFCREHLGKAYTRERIDAMDNGIKGYPNVMLTAGGPNCRHKWQRVSPLDTETLDFVNTGKRVVAIAERLEAAA